MVLRKLFVMAIEEDIKKIFYYSDYCSHFNDMVPYM